MSQTTFWNLLKENKIEIPIIQRDYAQGRDGKEYLRQTFLESLKNALDKNEVLKLDFVYGSAENGALQPLDGQQRLTTLWLLHWYMAMRAGKLHEAGDTLKKFTYETRISSQEFCEELCKEFHFKDYRLCKNRITCKLLERCPRKSIVDFITSQTWFYSSWKQDPTIQSMLRMLGGTQIKGKSGNDIPDGIEEVFKDKGKENFSKYWEILKSDNAPIVFYYLPLKDFGLSDDLYIKMNARGKQLTNFENFKADLVGYIQEKANENETWEKFLQSENNVGIPIKLDTEWTDIFWQNKTDDGRIDEIYFAFLNRYFLYSLLQRDDSAENLQEDKIFIYLYGSNGNDTDLQYTSKAFEFDKFPELHSSLESLEKTLDNLYKSLSDENSKISSEKFSAIKEAVKAPWKKDPDDNSFCFIPEYKSNIITNLTQSHRVVFFAVCKYFENKKYKEQSFKRWMRIVWNIVENSNVNNISSMQGCMKLIKELAEESFENREDNGNEDYCIYELLCTLEDGFVEKSFVKEQLKEEIAKAKQILDGDQLRKYKDNKTWEDVIIEAENYAFFKGAIRFLFRNEKGEWDWTDFDTKWRNAQRYFDENGVKDYRNGEDEFKYKADAIVLKAVLYHVNNFEDKIQPQKFVLDNKSGTWKNNILLPYDWANAVHQVLMGNLETKKRDEDCLLYQSLYNSNLLNYVANSMPGSRINKIGSRKFFSAIYQPHQQTGIIPDNNNKNKNFSRNKILSILEKESIIEINPDVVIASEKNDKIYKGWHVQFKYGSYDFLWTADNWISIIGQPDGFEWSENNEDGFQEKLDKCIETRNPNKS